MDSKIAIKTRRACVATRLVPGTTTVVSTDAASYDVTRQCSGSFYVCAEHSKDVPEEGNDSLYCPVSSVA